MGELFCPRVGCCQPGLGPGPDPGLGASHRVGSTPWVQLGMHPPVCAPADWLSALAGVCGVLALRSLGSFGFSCVHSLTVEAGWGCEVGLRVWL